MTQDDPAQAKPGPAKASYRDAIDLTIEQINRRARRFRDQVIAVVIFGAVPAVTAVTLRAFWPLAGWLIIVPVCGLFFCLDARGLGQWRAWVLAAWARGDIELGALDPALRSAPALPRATVDSMLALLGSGKAGPIEARAAAPTRHAVADVVARADRRQWLGLASKAGAAGLVAVAAVTAAATASATPLLLGIAPVVLLLGARIQRVPIRLCRPGADPGSDANTDGGRAAQVDASVVGQMLEILPT